MSLPRKWVSENRKAAQGTHPSMDGGGVELEQVTGGPKWQGLAWPHGAVLPLDEVVPANASQAAQR